MKLSDTYKRLPLSQIEVKRTERQRRDIRTDNLLESIRQNGILNPIIVTEDYVLVAGERRLACARELGHADVPVRLTTMLDEAELQLLELDENLRRSDLPWRDQVSALAKLHELNLKRDPLWNQTKTAGALGMSVSGVAQHLRIARDIENPKIAGATGLMAAYNILSRVDERRTTDALSDIADAGAKVLASPQNPSATASTPTSLSPPKLTALATPEQPSILNLDFIEWVKTYNGPRFNLVHCDFPYGIGIFSGPMGQRSSTGQAYDDSADVYWKLIEALCLNLDRVMTPSGHLMFWFSMQYYTKTLEAFRRLAPSLHFDAFPLIWQKSDNVGIAPDPRRGPRRVYETCLVASRDDRPIVKVVSNGYYAPTDKAHHPSTKPEPVLRHFMSMLVDDGTRLFDPTCGSGSALRAAESLGAKAVLGLEKDPEHFKNASSALRSFRTLRKASKS